MRQNKLLCMMVLGLMGLLSPRMGWAQLLFVTNNGSITITGMEYSPTPVALRIPSATNGFNITGIQAWAFNSNPSITNVIIPGSVTNVGDGAFFICTNLAGVIMSNGVSSIGSETFDGCTVLSNVTFPGTLTSIGSYAFAGCPALSAVTISGNGCVIGDEAFYYSGLASVAILNGVASLGTEAFVGCANLSSVVLSGNGLNIGTAAFNFCQALSNVVISNGVSNIGDQAFRLTAVSNITIPGSVTNIGDQAFEASKLAGITISNGLVSLGSAFDDCILLRSIVIPASVVSIGAGPFTDCTAMTNISVDVLNPNYFSVAGVLFNKSQTTLIQYPGGKNGNYVIPGTVMNIGSGAFAFALVTNVTIPGSVATIGDDAFELCPLTSVTIPRSVTSIGSEVFLDCFSLTNIAVDPLNSKYSSVNGVLFDKTGGTLIQFPCGINGSYSIPSGVATIGSEAFENCHLSSVTIPNSVASILTEAFWNCPYLTSLTIPGNVANIGTYAFWNCYNLTNVILAAGVANLGDDCFGACYSLIGIYFQGNAPAAGAQIFYNDPGTVYYLPGTTGWANAYGGLSAALWYQPGPFILSNGSGPGVQNNGFGFTISWATNVSVVVQACTNLINPVWQPLQTNALVNGTNYFNDIQWKNYPGRFYRVRSQ